MSAGYIKAEMDLFRKQAADVDIIITTAAIPGKKSPLLITADIIEQMKRGSVIVDMAAAGGGNCEGTVNGKVVTTKNGVKMIGYSDLACRLPTQSSQLYATNLVNLTKLLSKKKDGNIDIDFNDVVIRNMTVGRSQEARGDREEGARQGGSEGNQSLDQVRPACSRRALRPGSALFAVRLPCALHRFRPFLRRRLLCGLERYPCAPYSAYVSNQCDFRHYRRRRRCSDVQR